MYRGTTHAFRAIINQEGVRGIYKVWAETNHLPFTHRHRFATDNTLVVGWAGLWCHTSVFWALLRVLLLVL